MIALNGRGASWRHATEIVVQLGVHLWFMICLLRYREAIHAVAFYRKSQPRLRADY